MKRPHFLSLTTIISSKKRPLYLLFSIVSAIVITLSVIYVSVKIARSIQSSPVSTTTPTDSVVPTVQPKDWSSVQQQINTAKQLMNEDKLDEATAILSTIDYVQNMKSDPYWQTPVEDRYW